MSQVSIIDIEGNHPQIPTEFIADVGSAIPIANQLEILGMTVGAGIIPVYTSASGNTLITNVQLSQAIAASDPLSVGLAAFNSSHFTVDVDGFVSLSGGGSAIDSIAMDVGGPIGPTGSGVVTFNGSIAANSTRPIYVDGSVASTAKFIVQASTSAAGSVLANAGMASFNSTEFTVDGNGFVSLIGGSSAIDSVAVQTGTSPITPTGAGLITINGAVVAAGTNPIRSNGTSATTLAIEVQTSQAIAAADATKIGLCNFDSASFAVAATGFVTLSTTGVLKTLSSDSGTATPVAGNIQIIGGPGITTSATGATLTVNSVVFTDTTAATLAVDNGYFATAAGTYSLPATAAQGEMIIVVCDTSGAVVIDAPTSNFIRLGNQLTASSGNITSSAIGDSVTLRYRLSTLTWHAVSSTGNWTVN